METNEFICALIKVSRRNQHIHLFLLSNCFYAKNYNLNYDINLLLQLKHHQTSLPSRLLASPLFFIYNGFNIRKKRKSRNAPSIIIYAF